ncbi:MAG: hypothetical protein ACFFB3_16610 [Candidatus Hodarchaeota archaeon]
MTKKVKSKQKIEIDSGKQDQQPVADDWFAQYMIAKSGKFMPGTLKLYEWTLGQFRDWLALENIDVLDVQLADLERYIIEDLREMREKKGRKGIIPHYYASSRSSF